MLSKTLLTATFCLGVASNAWAGPKWVKAESDHFIVYSSVNAKATEAYVRNLEKYRYVIGAFYRRSGQNAEPEAKLNLYFLNDRNGFKQVWPKVPSGVGGFVRICSNGMAGYFEYDDDRISEAAKIEDQVENDSQTIIFHEYAHLFMFQNSRVAYPRWFVEGFAEYYGTTRVQDDQAVVGMAWSERVRSLTAPGGISYEDILRDAPSTRRLGSGYDLYAQSWLLTHWILSDATRSEALSGYLEARNRGDDPVKAFETAFGIPVKKLSGTLNAYLDKIQATVYRLKDMPTPKVTLTPMPASADKLLLWDSGVRSCLHKEVRQPVLQKIKAEAAKYPGDDYAGAVAARAEVLFGDASQALAYYQDRTKAHPEDPEGFFRLGQVWFLMAKAGKPASGEAPETQMRKARAAFGRAYQLDPLNAVNLYYFSRAANQGPNYPDDNTVNAAQEAHRLAPSVREYAIHAARLMIIKDQLPEAAATLSPLANNPHGGAFSEWVASIIAAINAGKSKDELEALMQKGPEGKGLDSDEL